MSDEIKKISGDSFSDEVKEGVVLVDFYADWCGPCRMMTPVLSKVAKEMTGKAKIAKVDIDAAQQVAAKFQVSSIPTLVLFKEGKEVGRLVGLRDEKSIKEFIETAV